MNAASVQRPLPSEGGPTLALDAVLFLNRRRRGSRAWSMQVAPQVTMALSCLGGSRSEPSAARADNNVQGGAAGPQRVGGRNDELRRDGEQHCAEREGRRPVKAATMLGVISPTSDEADLRRRGAVGDVPASRGGSGSRAHRRQGWHPTMGGSGRRDVADIAAIATTVTTPSWRRRRQPAQGGGVGCPGRAAR